MVINPSELGRRAIVHFPWLLEYAGDAKQYIPPEYTDRVLFASLCKARATFAKCLVLIVVVDIEGPKVMACLTRSANAKKFAIAYFDARQNEWQMPNSIAGL